MLKSRWRDLKDSYIKNRRKLKERILKSGSAATAKKQSSFAYADQMLFLEDALDYDKYVTH